MLKRMDLTSPFDLTILSRSPYAETGNLMASNPSLLTWAQALLERRNELFGSQPKMEAAAHDAISQTKISRLERGIINPVTGLNIQEFAALLEVFQWSMDDFTISTGLEIPLGLPGLLREEQDRRATLEAVKHLEVNMDELEKFDVFSSVSAGTARAKPEKSEPVLLSKKFLKRKGAKRENVRVYLCNGDCMVADSPRRDVREIRHGDHIAVDTARGVQIGEQIVLWDAREQKMLVKVFEGEQDEEHVIYKPLNSSYPPIVRRADEGKPIGVVIWRGGG
jgi:SOS-response transcriptional repressor LexA